MGKGPEQPTCGCAPPLSADWGQQLESGLAVCRRPTVSPSPACALVCQPWFQKGLVQRDPEDLTEGLEDGLTRGFCGVKSQSVPFPLSSPPSQAVREYINTFNTFVKFRPSWAPCRPPPSGL